MDHFPASFNSMRILPPEFFNNAVNPNNHMKKYIIVFIAVFALNTQAATSKFQSAYQDLAAEDPELVMYVNLEDDFQTIGNGLTRFYNAMLKVNPDMVPVPIDFARLLDHLGLTNLENLLLTSSWSAEQESFLNQGLLQLQENPKGLFNIFGQDNMEFSFADQVPSNADVLMEMQFRPMTLVEIIRQLLTDTMGPSGKALVDGQLNQPITEDGLTGLDLIQMIDTEFYFAQNVDPLRMENINKNEKSIQDYMGDQVWLIKGAGRLPQAIAPFLADFDFRPIPDDPYNAYIVEIPWAMEEKITWIFSHLPESGDLLVSNSKDARDWFLAGGESLAQQEEFQSASAQFPSSGLYFWYVSENAGQHNHQQLDAGIKMGMEQAISESGEEITGIEPIVQILQEILERFVGKNTGVAYLQDNQLRFKSFQPYSTKTTAALITLAAPGALTSAMAFGAYQ